MKVFGNTSERGNDCIKTDRLINQLGARAWRRRSQATRTAPVRV